MRYGKGSGILRCVMIIVSAGIVFSCGDHNSPVRAGHGYAESISVAIRLSKVAAGLLVRAEVIINASDIEEIRQGLAIDGDTIRGTIRGIPAGSGRTFTLNGYDADSTLVYTGSTTVDLPEGEVVPVHITVRRVEFWDGKTLTAALRKGESMEFVWIGPGTFMMGSSDSDTTADDFEKPQHPEVVSEGFFLGRYEVTQRQWLAVMDTSTWSGRGRVWEDPNNPAVGMSWTEMQEFVHQLNLVAEDSLYRLPSEVEWEYACRAGTATRWSSGDDESVLGEYSWYDANTTHVGEAYGHTVGMKRPNPWGLYDMHGNVFEWVEDSPLGYLLPGQTHNTVFYTPHHVIRGGSFASKATGMRSATRDSHHKDNYRDDLGGRILRIRR